MTLLMCLSLALSIDWLQTRVIAANPLRFYELNPILGRHPSLRRVNIYFSAWLVIVAVLWMVLPTAWGKAGCLFGIVFEAITVWRNHRLGLRIWGRL